MPLFRGLNVHARSFAYQQVITCAWQVANGRNFIEHTSFADTLLLIHILCHFACVRYGFWLSLFDLRTNSDSKFRHWPDAY